MTILEDKYLDSKMYLHAIVLFFVIRYTTVLKHISHDIITFVILATILPEKCGSKQLQPQAHNWNHHFIISNNNNHKLIIGGLSVLFLIFKNASETGER